LLCFLSVCRFLADESFVKVVVFGELRIQYYKKETRKERKNIHPHAHIHTSRELRALFLFGLLKQFSQLGS
jgi:hypothetical protein